MLVLMLAAGHATAQRDRGISFRAQVLRPCSTVVVDFVDGRVLARRVMLLSALAFALLLSAVLVALVLLNVHPLLALEIVSAVGLLAAHVVGRIAQAG